VNDYIVLTYVRDEMLANPYIDAEFAWDTFKVAQSNGDMRSLYDRWMLANDEEKIFIENLMKELLKCNISY
jgi:hypothetical protein